MGLDSIYEDLINQKYCLSEITSPSSYLRDNINDFKDFNFESYI